MEIEKESKIIRRILCGEHEAYARLIDEYKAPVYNFRKLDLLKLQLGIRTVNKS